MELWVVGGVDSMDEISLCIPENASSTKREKGGQNVVDLEVISEQRELLDRENNDIGINELQIPLFETLSWKPMKISGSLVASSSCAESQLLSVCWVSVAQVCRPGSKMIQSEGSSVKGNIMENSRDFWRTCLFFRVCWKMLLDIFQTCVQCRDAVRRKI